MEMVPNAVKLWKRTVALVLTVGWRKSYSRFV